MRPSNNLETELIQTLKPDVICTFLIHSTKNMTVYLT